MANVQVKLHAGFQVFWPLDVLFLLFSFVFSLPFPPPPITHALYKSMPFFMLYTSSFFFMQGEAVVSYFHSLSPSVPLVSLFNFNHTNVLYRSMSFFTQDTSFLSFYPILFLALFWATHKAILSSHEARTPFLSIYFFFYSRLFLSHSISLVTPGGSLLSF